MLNLGKRSLLKITLSTLCVAATMQMVHADEPIPVVATFSILGNMVSEIGGEHVNVTTLVGPDGDAHVYQPTPKDARSVSEAELMFMNGLEFEGWLERLVKAASFDGSLVVATDGIQAIAFDDHDDHDDHGHSAKKHDDHDDHDHHDHGGVDPHVWHDPHNIIKMGEVVSKSLKKDVPERKLRKAISNRFKTFDKTLEDLDKWIVKQVSTIPSSNRVIVSKHKAMDYYGDAFGFETISLLDFLGHSSSLRPQNISKVFK